jgi:ribosome-binding protein aMBF1 (putative translation factor)
LSNTANHDVGEIAMPTSVQSINRGNSPKELSEPRQLRYFDRSVAASVGRCIMLRRTLCGLSRHQLGTKLGIDSSDVEAYEQGTKRITAKLLLETAKILRAMPVLFFQ